MTVLKMYTDGACSGNQNDTNAGGWGAILEFGEHRKEIFGSAANTTNNQMELTAVIAAFRALKLENQTVEVYTDSSYVANCFIQKWYVGWEKNNWHNSQKKPVENKELWMELLALTRKHHVTFYRVKGHVNLDSKTTDFNKLYEKFKSTNGNRFTFEDFKYITAMNNRADELANMGVSRVKGEM